MEEETQLSALITWSPFPHLLDPEVQQTKSASDETRQRQDPRSGDVKTVSA